MCNNDVVFKGAFQVNSIPDTRVLNINRMWMSKHSIALQKFLQISKWNNSPLKKNILHNILGDFVKGDRLEILEINIFFTFALSTFDNDNEIAKKKCYSTSTGVPLYQVMACFGAIRCFLVNF